MNRVRKLLAAILANPKGVRFDDACRAAELLGFAHKGGSLYMSYLQAKEQLAGKAQAGSFGALGIGGIG